MFDRGLHSMLGIEGNVVAATRKSEPGDLGAILERIDRLLKLNDITQRHASEAAGNPDYIRTMRKQYQLGKQFSADEESLRRLVEPLNTTWSWLWSGEGNEFVPRSRNTLKRAAVNSNEVRHQRHRILTRARTKLQAPEAGLIASGTVQSGFFEGDQIPDPAIRVPLDPNYPADAQSAFLVIGTSCNDIAVDGDHIISVAITPTTALVVGQLVIVSRKRAGLIETTVRRFNVVNEQMELRFPSSDPRFRDQEPISLPLFTRQTKAGDDDIELRGLVVFVYRQV